MPGLSIQLIPKHQGALVAALVGAALLAAMCFAIGHRDGLWVTPDGWAYWEGAVSLSEGRGYSYFSGHAIVAWPPLYSLWLAIWTGLLGPTALSISVATGVLVSLEAVAWLGLALRLVPGVRRPVAMGLAAVYIIAFLVLNQSQPLAHCMLYLFLPLQLMLAHLLITQPVPRLLPVVGLVLVSVLASLSHHLGLAFTFVICAAILLASQRRAPKLPAMIVAPMLALLAWAIARFAFGQAGSHAIGVDKAARPFIDYLVEGLAGCAELLAPGPGGWIILAALTLLVFLYRTDPGIRLAALFAILLFTASLLLFSFVHINDPFTGRFLHFAPLLVIPPLLLRLAAVGPVRTALFAALVMPHLIWASFQSITLPQPEGAIPNAASIARDVPPGEMQVRESRLLVGPIDWEEPRAGGQPRIAAGR